MKRFAAILVALVMTVSLTVTAALAAGSDARLFYDAATELMFETNNVTLTGSAEFRLDGKRFKSAQLEYIQNYENSKYKLDLQTPRWNDSDKPDRESGYTIIANGDYVYVIEVIYPGVYKTGGMLAQSTILRKSVQMDMVTELVGILADQADTLLGEKAVTVEQNDNGGKEMHLVLTDDVPTIVNTALNLLYQFAAKRYFGADMDRVNERFMGSVEDYMTIAEGILYGTKSLSLKQADLRATVDAHGNLEQIRGDVSLYLNTKVDGVRTLDITFSLDVSDLGSSYVGTFDPAEYGVVPAK